MFVLKGNLVLIGEEGWQLKSKTYVIGRHLLKEFKDTPKSKLIANSNVTILYFPIKNLDWFKEGELS